MPRLSPLASLCFTKKQVIDYGCGEAALTSILIGETWQDHQIRRIACVDIDLDCVTAAASECQPQEYDQGDGLRIHDLTIDLYQGSVSEADQRLLGYNALACAEVYVVCFEVDVDF